MRALLLLTSLAGCRTQPFAELPDLAATAPSGFVSCGRDQTCSIGAGEHCCDSVPLVCRTTPCGAADQFDCDGPEDCPGGACKAGHCGPG